MSRASRRQSTGQEGKGSSWEPSWKEKTNPGFRNLFPGLFLFLNILRLKENFCFFILRV